MFFGSKKEKEEKVTSVSTDKENVVAGVEDEKKLGKIINAYSSIYRTFDRNVNTNKTVVIGAFILIAFMAFLMYENNQKNMYAVDDQGDIVSMYKINSADAFKIEADNTIRMFYARFFTYDKSNWRQQTERGLFLGGASVKTLYETYLASNWYNAVVNNDLIVSSSVDKIEMQVVGNQKANFIAFGKQTISRYGLQEVRNLTIKGLIFAHPNGRVAQKNPHGLIIDNLVIVDNKVIMTDGKAIEQDDTTEE